MLSLTPTTTATPDDAIAVQVAAFEADLRRRNDPAVMAENAAQREWQTLHGRIRTLTGLPPLVFRGGKELLNQFAAAEAAGDIDAAREIVVIAHNAVNPNDRIPVPESEARRARRIAAEEDARREQAEARRRYAEEERQAFLRRFPDSGFVLRAIEQRGALRLAEDGTVLYTGAALDPEILRALELHQRDVRIALRQRWFDRVVLAAPEPSGPATQAAA